MAVIDPLLINIGYTFEKSFAYKDSALVAIDLTGYTAEMHIRDEVDDVSALIELTTANSRITLGGTAGTIDLLISADDTAALSPLKEAGFDFKLISAGGIESLLFEGFVELKKRNTRD